MLFTLKFSIFDLAIFVPPQRLIFIYHCCLQTKPIIQLISLELRHTHTHIQREKNTQKKGGSAVPPPPSQITHTQTHTRKILAAILHGTACCCSKLRYKHACARSICWRKQQIRCMEGYSQVRFEGFCISEGLTPCYHNTRGRQCS